MIESDIGVIAHNITIIAHNLGRIADALGAKKTTGLPTDPTVLDMKGKGYGIEVNLDVPFTIEGNKAVAVEPEPEPEPEPAPEPAAAPETEKKEKAVTHADVRKAGKAVIVSKGIPTFKGILRAHGVEQVPDLELDKLPAVLKELKAVIEKP